jgi:hypothetical protein
MMKLHRPTRSVHEAFKEYFWGNSEEPGGVPSLIGTSETVYGLRDDAPDFDTHADDRVRNDLLSLGARYREDRLTRLLRGTFPMLWKRRGSDADQVLSLSDYRLGLVVGVVNVVVVAGLLFGAVFNLYYIRSEEKRLGILAAYTVLFAAAVTFLSTATRGEVFAASAAYAAVLVVFVSGGIGNE